MPTLVQSPADTETAFVREHQAAVWRYLRFLGCPNADAADLTQDALLAALENGSPRHPRPRATAFLRATARNLFLAALRARRRELPAALRTDPSVADAVFARGIGDDGGTARLAALHHCIEQLPLRSRQALDLRYRDQASRPAMGAALGLDPEGVKTLLRRLRAGLRRCIVQRLETCDD